MFLVSAAQMRDLDRATIEDFGTPGEVLMERAGEGACAMLLGEFSHLESAGAPAIVVAGKGNNGGDGFVIARLLLERGIATKVILLARRSQVRGDALLNLRRYEEVGGSIVEVETAAALGRMVPDLGEAACVVDALLGTGLSSEVRGLYADAIAAINSCGAPVFAVDIPSGLDADSGRPLGTAVQAEATATFGFAKLGQVMYPGIEHCGRLAVVDIGIDERAIAAHPPRARLLDDRLSGAWAPRRAADAHKGSAGHLLVVAGARGKTGAAILASRAGLRGGAGLVTLAGPASVNDIFATSLHELMTDPLPDEDGVLSFCETRIGAALEGKAAVVAGPGLGTARGARRTVLWLLDWCRVPLVLDADALNVVSGRTAALRRAQAPVVLTPHPGEMARLAGIDTAAVQADRIGVARRFAESHRCTVVLKGARTVVAAADGMVWVNPTGNPGMASGGMGDVLAGLIGALAGQGLGADQAACVGVYLHGLAADRVAEGGAIGMLATDVAEAIPRARRELDDRVGF